MYPNPYGYDENPEKFKPIKARPRWWTKAFSITLIIVLIVPMFLSPASLIRDLYIMGFMLCVIIFATYRITFSALFGERAAKREFSLPNFPRRYEPIITDKPQKRERIRSTDGIWLEVVDENYEKDR